MHRILAVVFLCSALVAAPGCGEEPPEEPVVEATPEATPDPDASLFASSAEDIVMKEAPQGSVFAAAKAEPAPAPAAAAAPPPADSGGRTITPAQVKAVVKAKTPQVRACYERELKKQDGLRGKVVLGWTIKADGRVTGARAVRNSTRNTAMIPCMISAVSSWRFPRAEAGFDVEYPFVFKPRDW